MKNDVEGYRVKYEDGYESWSPKEVFERAYRSFDGGMSFGSALELLKMGFKVARKGWNGKGMFLVMNCASEHGVCGMSNSNLRYFYKTKGIERAKANPYIVMKAADDTMVMGWLASQTDMLSNDWVVVE